MDVDALARNLAWWARRARSFPRGAFEESGIRIPLVTRDGRRIGHGIAGRGIVLDADLSRIGITKSIPGVLERSPWMRAMERLADDRAAITTMAALRTAHATTKQIGVYNDTFAAIGTAAEPWTQLQFASSTSPTNFTGAGKVAPTRVSPAGAINSVFSDPAPGNTKYLVGISKMADTALSIGGGVLVDALSIFPFDGSITTLQTINSAPLTRVTSGAGVYYNIGADISGTFSTPPSPTFTIGYTNSAGTSGRSVQFYCTDIASGTLAAVENISTSAEDPGWALPFQSGDSGIRSIETVQLSVGSVACVLGGIIYKPLFFIHGTSELGCVVERDGRAEPEALCLPLDVDGSGVLGYHTMIWSNVRGGGPTSKVTFVLTMIEG